MNDSPLLPSGLTKAYAACAKWSLWLLVTAWLVLALAWGALHGFIVPRIGELRPTLETEAGRVLGVPVRIGAVSARSEGLVPTLELQSVVLLDPQGREALRLPRVVAALSPRSLWNLGFSQLYIERPELDIRRTADGRIVVAGLDFSGPGSDDGRAADWFFRQTEFVVRGGTLRWTDERRAAPVLTLSSVDAVVRNSAWRHAIRLDATPPPEWGERFSLQGVFRQPLLSNRPGRWQDWEGQLYADLPRVDLSHLRRHAELGIDVASGRGALRAWADLDRGEWAGGVVDLSVASVETTLGAGLRPLSLASLSGRVRGKRLPGGFELETRGLQFDTADGQRWPGGNVFLSWTDANGRRPAAGELRADRLELGALGQLGERLPLGPATHAALAAYAPQGLVETVHARWQGPLQAPQKYEVRGRVQRLEVAAGQADGHATPGIRGAAIDFDVTDAGGKARLALQSGALELPGVFEEPALAFDRLSADLQWQREGDRLSVSATHLKFSNADAQGEGQATWRTGDTAADRLPGVLDLTASLARADGTRIWRYLPLGVPKATRDYVRQSVVKGHATAARFRVRGNLQDFPFRQARDGEFRISAKVHDLTYAFAPKPPSRGGLPWPALADLSGELVFERGGMRVEGARGGFAGAPGLRLQAAAEIADLREGTVNVNGDVRGPLGEALAVVQRSPLSELMGDALGKATATGDATVRLQLTLPLAQLERSKVQGSVALVGNDVQITPDTPVLARSRGTVNFTERGFALAGVQARALGGDVRLEGGSRPPNAQPSVVVRAQGTATAEGLRNARELGVVARIARQATGSAPYALNLAFRKGRPELLVTSTLQGLALDLPAPLGKPADQPLPLRYENVAVGDAPPGVRAADQLTVELGRLASIQYLRDLDGAEPRVLRGVVAVGLAPGEAPALPDQGVLANVQLASVDLDAWRQAFGDVSTVTPGAPSAPSATTPSTASGYLPTTLAVRARELTAEGRTLNNVVVGGSRDGLTWRANVDADQLNGYVEYRQSASGAGAGRVYARLARLSIAAAAAREVETLLDTQPGNIPALDVVVDDFELRGRKLGRLEIDAINRGPGAVAREGGVREWRLNKLSLFTPEGNFQATGNWAAIDAQAVPPGTRLPVRQSPERRRTVMNFRLDIQDAGQLLARFGMKDVVRRGRGRMEGQVAWVGSPLTMDYPSMTGTFNVNVESGQFLKAEPGLAKLLGVLSLQALPRRLTLDFRDVFSQGFAFDFLRGDITIQQGIAATNNLQMKGVNAAVLMEGKADIARETQDIRVVVVPEINAGTASLVATVINPAIGLGTFLAQMFLREPLARAATQQFQIDGTWADPRITKIAREAAAAETRTVGNNGAR